MSPKLSPTASHCNNGIPAVAHCNNGIPAVAHCNNGILPLHNINGKDASTSLSNRAVVT